ncbi:ABC transporter ATP-binding protein [Nocardiopsis changdeensis]|uniref:ABC transporter ATP-binding protein n=1 Tax=Nocardiopsis changdeensis TaxID=2831969 RepID=A0ABX8BT97_9ACTN|nr:MULTISPECIES: ABC transporter ATP-binding protein [Nocardiopsis]QUX25286.1 ABC transporter ATP-binding protein [Nocardiopsis changdeensis]QYX35673.1 ABC transporter ATP-binding protein [Nocardiopsis sp. MT53]
MRVVLEGVSVVRGSRTVVHDVSVEAAPGSVLGVLGTNGSGKSTLLRTVCRVLRPSTGRVLLDGDDVRDLRPREVARRVAVVAQDSHEDFGITALESVLLGRTPHHRGFSPDTDRDLDIAREAMDRVGVLGLAGRQVAELSGGERQRVLLARAITQQARVLVLDEPTNHLDTAHRLELMDLIGELGLTTLIALHDLDLALAHCDRVALLVEGRLDRSGTPAEVLTPDVLRDRFRVDADIVHGPRRPHLLLHGVARPAAPDTLTEGTA